MSPQKFGGCGCDFFPRVFGQFSGGGHVLLIGVLLIGGGGVGNGGLIRLLIGGSWNGLVVVNQ